VQYSFNLVQSVVHSVAAAVGFTMAIVIFAFIREKMESNDVPQAFKGFPIALITASLLSFAFLGFQGMI
jgi:electron transport complex protein RnfA